MEQPNFEDRHKHLVHRHEVIVRDKNNDPSLIDFFRVDEFLKMLKDNPEFGKSEFFWFRKSGGAVKPVILYLLWRGLNVEVPVEEIREVERLTKPKDTFDCFSQFHHGYADDGFDVRTLAQNRKIQKYGDVDSQEAIRPSSGLVLFSTEPGPKASTRALCPDDPLDWDLRKKEFNYHCVCCGNKEGEIGRSGLIVTLEKGHADSRKPYSHSNIIPQCASCNNHKDDEVYSPSSEDPNRWIVTEKLKRSRPAIRSSSV